MPLPLPKKEADRRIKALEATKRPGQPNGAIAEASIALGNLSPGALSKWLITQKIYVGNKPSFSRKECIDEYHRLVKELGRIPTRHDWRDLSPQKVAWRTHWGTYEGFTLAAGISSDDTRILLLDIETAPNRAWFWGGTWKVNINPDWIDAAGYVLCWTAKWLGESTAHFHRIRNKNHKALLWPIHKMLGEAHAVIHYNGSSFDIPTLNKEFLTHGLKPPSPYKQVDLLRTMRDGFRFPNNKLDYIVKTLSIGEKLRHEGPQMWLDCMEDDPQAWGKMEMYNRRDVELLEKLYRRLLPWIKGHPNRSAISGFSTCPSCGSNDFKRDGTYLATLFKYERYQCRSCGAWFRGTKTVTYRKGDRFTAAAQ